MTSRLLESLKKKPEKERRRIFYVSMVLIMFFSISLWLFSLWLQSEKSKSFKDSKNIKDNEVVQFLEESLTGVKEKIK